MTAFIVLGLLSATAVAAPATKPASTTKPAAKPDPTTVEVTFEHGCRFRVPKVWKIVEQKENAASIQFPGGSMVIGVGRWPADLKSAVQARKDDLKDAKGLKIIKEGASTLGGVESWETTYEAQTTAKEVDPKTGKEKVGGKPMILVIRSLATTSLKDGILLQSTFVAGDKDFDARVKLGQKVLSSFEWIPATDKPNEKK
jgi:hypothetical protein